MYVNILNLYIQDKNYYELSYTLSHGRGNFLRRYIYDIFVVINIFLSHSTFIIFDLSFDTVTFYIEIYNFLKKNHLFAVTTPDRNYWQVIKTITS